LPGAEIIEVKGELLDSYGRVQLFEGFPYKRYEIKLLEMADKEKRLVKTLAASIGRTYSLDEIREGIGIQEAVSFANEFNSEIIQTIEINELLLKLPSEDLYAQLKASLTKLFEKYFPEMKAKESIASEVLSNSIGYGPIEPIIEDPLLEEIMVNGANRAVFVFHKRHGMCKTNIVMQNERQVLRLCSKIAFTVGKKFDEAHPLLDARLPDGSRANATFSLVTPFGSSLTIRKFTKIPISIVDLIGNRTISAETASFLWLMVEGLKMEPMNIIIAGGAGSGKTTLMNSLATFMRYDDRIISIEDTLELDLGARENWIQMESRPGTHKYEEIQMDDLLRNSLRMRPDRLLVGEVRGKEAQTLFVAMDTGHRGILGTVHANTSRELLLRLKSAPMNVPNHMLPLVNISVVMFRMYDRERGLIRRVKEVAELERMEEKILLSNVFEWNRRTDTVEKTNVPCRMLDKLAEKLNMKKNEIKEELLIRHRILEWMLESGIKSASDVEKIIQKYYLDPQSVLQMVAGKSA